MDFQQLKQLEQEELSSVIESDQNTTLFGFDNKSLLFVSDQPYFRAKEQSETSEEPDFASGFLTSQNTSFQDSAQSSFVSRISNFKAEKLIVPKIPLQIAPKRQQEVIFEAEESNSLHTQQTISSLNDDQKDEAYLEGFNLSWSDLIGINEQKQIIYTMVMMPLKLPTFFKKIPPTNTLLIYGPQNCGKASVVKCMANEFKEIKVIYVKASNLLNKRNGEEYIEPKKVFKEVQKHNKVLVFIENIDDLFGYRDIIPDKDQDMMIQSQQCAQYILITLQEIQKKRGVFIYASSRFPWKLNLKVQKFFQKSVSIKWPSKEWKVYLIKRQLQNFQITSLSDEQLQRIAAKAKRYSCKEIQTMVQQIYENCQEKSKFNIKIMKDDEVQGYSLFNSKQPKEEDFLQYIDNNQSELKNYDKYSFENYEEIKKELLKTQSQKREEMLKI